MVEVAGGGGGGSVAGPRSRLRKRVDRWKSIRQEIEDILDLISGTPEANTPEQQARLQELRDTRADIVDSVQQLVTNHPGLRDKAIDMGFREDLLPTVAEPKTPGTSADERAEEQHGVGGSAGTSGGQQGTGGGGTAPGGGEGAGGGSGGGQGGPGQSNRWLPGIKGKDFEVVRYNGKVYVKYKIAHVGAVTMRVPPNKFKAYGIREGEGRQLTKAEHQRLHFLGNAADILVHGENRHPFRQWIEQAEALYGGTGMLRNKEVMRVFLEGYAKGWSQEVIQGKLRQTNWYDESTEYSRTWGFLTTAEKKGQIESIGNQIKAGLQEVYGDNWLEYFPEFSDKQLNNWAKKIATGVLGATGSPTAAMDLFVRRQSKKAEKIQGTPAWMAKQQREAELGEFLGRPENLREDLRQQTIEMLGYVGKDAERLEGETLDKWAERIAYSQLNDQGNPYTQADFTEFLRKRKQHLFPYLDPDETFFDYASPFKAKVEQLWGRSVGWDDPVLRDLTARDEQGQVKGRLTDWDFERMARKDNRFWQGRVAAQEGFGLLQTLNDAFNGSVL